MNSWLEAGLMTDLLGDVIRQSENKKFQNNDVLY